MTRRLEPTTGIIHTAINSGMTPIDAVAEFVDNSFGTAAGNADNITIIDAKEAMLFLDNGVGVEDINKMFTLGDSGSRSSSDDIGRFGVGSKFGALTFGTHVTVHTVRDGGYRTHSVDWDEVIRKGRWPNAHDGKTLPASKAPSRIAAGGTIIVVKDLKSNRRPLAQTYSKRLGLRFSSWLENGKDIRFCRATSINTAMKGDFKEDISIRKEFAEFMSNKVKIESTVNGTAAGRPFKLTIGVLPNGDRDLNGVHINFGGRTIEFVQNNLPGQRMPTKFFARVDLGKEWKSCLNYNKTVIVTGKEDLLSEVERLSKDILARLASDDMKKMFERLSLEISNMLSVDLGNALKKAADGEEKAPAGGFLNGEDEIENPGGGRGSADPEKEEPAKKSGGSFKLELAPENYGKNADAVNAIMELNQKPPRCIIQLNLDYPIIKTAVSRSPQNAPATLLLAVGGMARSLAKDKDMATRLLGEEFMADHLASEHDMEIEKAIYNRMLEMTIEDKAQEKEEE